MKMEDQHYQFMKRAIDLARKGGKAVKSNPLVGAVIVLDGLIISEGYHQYYGGPHAEVNAINSIQELYKHRIQEMTLYVTLEPCCVFGKTPPCTDKIIQSGIRNVVVGCLDPNPNVNGAGVAYLQAQGISVTVLHDDQAQRLIRKFIVNHIKKSPYVILKWVMSYDHYIGHQSEKIWFSNHTSQVLSHRWRTEVDGILVGKNTALLDNPQLTSRLYYGEQPVRILLDSTLEIPSSHYLLADHQHTIIFNTIINKIEENKEYIVCEEMDMDTILSKLFEKGIYILLIEGGAKVLRSLIQSGHWHEARICTCTRKLADEYPTSLLVEAPQCVGIQGESILLDEDRWHMYYNDIGV